MKHLVFFLPRLEGSGNDVIPCEAFFCLESLSFYVCVVGKECHPHGEV